MRYSEVSLNGYRINDMDGGTTFSADGTATYEYKYNYYGESSTVNIELREDGIEVDGTFLNRRVVED